MRCYVRPEVKRINLIKKTAAQGPYPEVADHLGKLYDQWWTRIQPGLVNEDAYYPTAKYAKHLRTRGSLARIYFE